MDHRIESRNELRGLTRLCTFDSVCSTQSFERDINHLADSLSCTRDEALLLMIGGCGRVWDEHALISRYWEGGLREELGVRSIMDPPPKPTEPGARSIMDPVTMEEVSLDDCDACACGHWAPKLAWAEYLQAEVCSLSGGILTRCMFYSDGCKEKVRGRMFKQYLSADTYAKWEQKLLERYVAMQLELYWCPHAGCTEAVRYSGVAPRDVPCAHGHLYCSGCHEAAHAPAKCTEASAWTKRESDEGQNVQWLQANTKRCPKCHKNIEKNQGCNHMTCQRSAGK